MLHFCKEIKLKQLKKSVIGYHYTSYENWLNIKKQGLVPYPLSAEFCNTFSDHIFSGIYIFTEKLKGLDHTGVIMHQATTKNSSKIVCLKVRYNKILEFIPYIESAVINIKTKLVINKLFIYDKKPIDIIPVKISPKNIELEKVYDLSKVCKH